MMITHFFTADICHSAAKQHTDQFNISVWTELHHSHTHAHSDSLMHWKTTFIIMSIPKSKCQHRL